MFDSETLPNISVSIVRSLMPKVNNFKTDMKERNISLAMLSEIWEKSNCKKQQSEVETMLNIDGLKYVSTHRTTKRGGGAAIIGDLKNFSLEKLEIGNLINWRLYGGL